MYCFNCCPKEICTPILFFASASLSSQTPVAKELIRLLKIPLDSYNNILVLLKLKHFGMVVEYLDYEGRRSMGKLIISNALDHKTQIPLQEQVDQILLLVAPLVQDQVDQPAEVGPIKLSVCLAVCNRLVFLSVFPPIPPNLSFNWYLMVVQLAEKKQQNQSLKVCPC